MNITTGKRDSASDLSKWDSCLSSLLRYSSSDGSSYLDLRLLPVHPSTVNGAIIVFIPYNNNLTDGVTRATKACIVNKVNSGFLVSGYPITRTDF
jgi:hypothetical protein